MAKDKPIERMALDFIDPLFAVVMSISFVTVMETKWFKKPILITEEQTAFEILVLILGYLTVILSWVGYHQSIATKPIKLSSKPGFYRFILDILLLIGYWLLLVKFESLWFVLLMLVLINFLFILWDQMKRLEYKEEDNLNSQKRRGVTSFWFILFLVLFAAFCVENWGDSTLDYSNWVFLFSALIFTILYRLHKVNLYLGSIVKTLGILSDIITTLSWNRVEE